MKIFIILEELIDINTIKGIFCAKFGDRHMEINFPND